MKKVQLNVVERNTLLGVIYNEKARNTLESIRRISRVADVLDKVEFPKLEKDTPIQDLESKEISFEDADFEFLKQRFNEYDGWDARGHTIIIALGKKLE